MEFDSAWLKEYSKNHVKYEIEMLFSSIHGFLESTNANIDQQNLRNMAVESFCIHLRNLIIFLYNKPTGDDVSASMYVTTNNWFDILGDKPKVLSDARERVGKEVAHLTAKRRSDDEWQKKQWYFIHYVENILPGLVLFAENADKDCLDKSVVDLIDKLRREFLN